MRIGAVVVLLTVLATSCGGGGFFRQYEYEEEMYLSLDGSATVYVNSSVDALNALRGATFDTSPAADLDREAIRAYFTSAVSQVTRRPSLSKRNGRNFVHVRVNVPDITKLDQAAPFAWSTYRFVRDGELFRYQQTIGASASRGSPSASWNGEESIAIRLHLPSRIVYHNAGPGNPRRGNILEWEQPLSSRLESQPMEIEARMDAQSVLYRTLFLFAATFVVVAIGFVLLIWWIVRRGGKTAAV
jgi:hypothetical protein